MELGDKFKVINKKPGNNIFPGSLSFYYLTVWSAVTVHIARGMTARENIVNYVYRI